MNSLVSIISPCYNGEKYLPAFFDSVLCQTYKRLELYLIDDGSVDNTSLICKQYACKFEQVGIKFIYIYQENQGQASAINRALPLFSGEYLTWFDSDDIMLPNYIMNKVKYLRDNLDKGFVLCDGAVVDEDDVNNVIRKLHRFHNDKEDNLFRDLIDVKNVVFAPGTIMATRKAMLNAIPSLNIYEGRQGQNLQLMLPLAYTAKWGYIDEILFKYVLHNDSHSHRKRDYEEFIFRCEEFEKLIVHTIEQIPGMSKIEKNNWYNYTHNKYTREKLFYAYKFRNKRDADSYQSELKKNGVFTLLDVYAGYRISCLIQVFKYAFRKLFS